VIKEICDYFGVNWIDLRTSGFTTQNLDNLFTDQVHPNARGMGYIENRVKKYMTSLLTPLASS
jgi:lysophospholipase L1-like esterase